MTRLVTMSGRVGLTRMWTFLAAAVPLSVSPMIQRTVSPAATGPEPTSCSPSCRATSVYSPILLLKPFGFRIAPDTLSSEELRERWLQVRLGCLRLSPSCPFRLLHTFLPLHGQRGITPAFGYSAPHPSAEGTSTPMIHALPSAHYEPIRLPAAPSLTFTGLRLISRSTARWGLPCCPDSRCVRAVVTTPVGPLGACRSLPQQCQLSL